MKFFTAGDVLDRASKADPADPVVIELDATIQEALEVMFQNEFSQLPVRDEGQIVGAITRESVCDLLKVMDEVRPKQRSVKNAAEDPVFVSPEEDVYDLFDTLAAADYVLVGTRDELAGIVTQYDVFHFLKEQIEPFLMIGEIERSLRAVFEEGCTDVEDKIDETFAERAEYDESFTPPETLQEFTFRNYHTFVSKNWNDVSDHFHEDREYVLWLLEEVRRTRNVLFHFRGETDAIDRDVLTIAHRHITTVI